MENLHSVFDSTDLDVEFLKIRQKIDEARYNPGDVKPLADCMLSLLLAARSSGYRAGAVLEELERAARKNKDREWRKMPDGTYQSI